MTIRSVIQPGPALRAVFSIAGGYLAVGGLLLLSTWLIRAMGYTDLATRLPWYLSRAAGVTAYLLLTATTLFGLAQSTGLLDRWPGRPVVFALHEYLSWLMLAALGLHLGGLLVDSYLPFGAAAVLIPFAAPYRPGAVALGVIALYLTLVITGSFYVRAWIGQRVWRALHMASFVLYALATAHGILAGSSTGQPWMQWLYLISAGSVLTLVAYQMLYAKRSPSRSRRLAPASSEVPAGGASGHA
jgi:sulfoxide reductase heme-binding subunit YedZ